MAGKCEQNCVEMKQITNKTIIEIVHYFFIVHSALGKFFKRWSGYANDDVVWPVKKLCNEMQIYNKN